MDSKYPRLVSLQQRGLAVLRIGTGVFFLALAATKFDPLYVTQFPKLVSTFVVGHPIGAYRVFLEEFVQPFSETMVYLLMLLELAVGAGLLAGLFTGLAAAMGFFLCVNYALATAGVGITTSVLFWVLSVVLAVLGVSYAGTTWGLDRKTLQKMPWWFAGWFHFEYREF